MALKDRIDSDLKQAMRDRATARLEAIRMLRAAIQRREVDERTELDDPEVLAVIEKLVKQGRDAESQFEKGGRQDLASKEQAQIAIFSEYLPEQLTAEAVAAIVDEVIAETGAEGMRDMGKVMGQIKPRLAGQADMGQVSALVKQRLEA
ncbi:MAG: GatB/YqeY domain-containing protein [Gammaproteobacteria bacterium]|jgi:hypothetical protein|nr:GatB/YqeY domain-containing protein [Gammaproteobacteria bacterium]